MDAGGNSFGTAMTNAAAFLADSLSSLVNATFAQLANIKSPDIGSGRFLSTYAAGSGIAMFVLVVMLARLFYRTSSGEISGQALADSLWRWTPGAMVLVLFGPGLGQLIVQLTDAAAASISKYFGSDISSLPKRLTSMVVIDDPSKLPGGPILALLIMAVAFVGVLGLVGGLVAQTLALYLAGAVMSVAFVATIVPATRSRALRLPSTWLGLLLAKPLLFFLIGALARISSSAFTVDNGADPGWKVLLPALMGALALLFVGLAPWALIRAAPRLPERRADRVMRAVRAGSAGAARRAPSATMLQMSYRRMQGFPGGQVAAASASAPAVSGPGIRTEPSGSPRGRAVRAGVPRRMPATQPADRPAAAAGSEPQTDPTVLPPFSEQAIDAAPPAMPQLVRPGEQR